MKALSRDFYIIAALIVFQKSEYLIKVYTGLSLFSVLPFSPLVLIMILVLFAMLRVNSKRGFSVSNLDPFLSILLVFTALQFFRGLMYNSTDIVLQEFSTGVIVLYSYILGKNRLIDFSNKNYLILLAFAAFLVFLGVFHFREHLAGELNTLLPTATLAYEISPIMDFWPLVFLTKYLKRRDIYAIMPLLIYLFFQIFFLKRAPSVRAVMYFLAAETVYFMLSKSTLDKLIKFVVIFIIIGSFIAFMPRGLKDRFGNGDTSRQEETISMLSQLSSFELFVGKGLGGWFELEDGGGIIKLHNGKSGKHIVHIGLAYPILKGGLLLLLLISMHYIYALGIGVSNFYTMSFEEHACLAFLFVYGAFRLIEGPFSPGALFDGICFGYSIGRLYGKKRDTYLRR